jgi:hypothetical protein
MLTGWECRGSSQIQEALGSENQGLRTPLVPYSMLEVKERMGALTEAEDQLLEHHRETSPEFFLLSSGTGV